MDPSLATAALGMRRAGARRWARCGGSCPTRKPRGISRMMWSASPVLSSHPCHAVGAPASRPGATGAAASIRSAAFGFGNVVALWDDRGRFLESGFPSGAVVLDTGLGRDPSRDWEHYFLQIGEFDRRHTWSGRPASGDLRPCSEEPPPRRTWTGYGPLLRGVTDAKSGSLLAWERNLTGTRTLARFPHEFIRGSKEGYRYRQGDAYGFSRSTRDDPREDDPEDSSVGEDRVCGAGRPLGGRSQDSVGRGASSPGES